MAKTHHVAYIAILRNEIGRFPNGSRWLRSSPFQERQHAVDWAAAMLVGTSNDVILYDIDEVEAHISRIIWAREVVGEGR